MTKQIKINIYLKPTLLRGWYKIKETKKCLVVRKEFKQRYGYKNFIGDCAYIPKKEIDKIEVNND